MDTRTGEITHFGNMVQFEKLQEALAQDRQKLEHMVPVDAPPNCHVAKVGRNSPCPCESGYKFKKCCLGRSASAAERRDIAAEISAASDRLAEIKAAGELA